MLVKPPQNDTFLLTIDGLPFFADTLEYGVEYGYANMPSSSMVTSTRVSGTISLTGRYVHEEIRNLMLKSSGQPREVEMMVKTEEAADFHGTILTGTQHNFSNECSFDFVATGVSIKN